MRTATALNVVGWILLISGIIAGIVVMATMKVDIIGLYGNSIERPHPDRFIYGIGVMFGGIVSALPLMGLGVVIQTLIKIKGELKSRPESTVNVLGNIGEEYRMKSLD